MHKRSTRWLLIHEQITIFVIFKALDYAPLPTHSHIFLAGWIWFSLASSNSGQREEFENRVAWRLTSEVRFEPPVPRKIPEIPMGLPKKTPFKATCSPCIDQKMWFWGRYHQSWRQGMESCKVHIARGNVFLDNNASSIILGCFVIDFLMRHGFFFIVKSRRALLFGQSYVSCCAQCCQDVPR